MAQLAAFLLTVCVARLGAAPLATSEHVVQIDDSGSMTSVARRPRPSAGAPPEEAPGSDPSAFWLDVMRKAKATVANTRKTGKMMRQEVRRHLPMELERIVRGEEGASAAARQMRLKQFASLMESGEVNCSASSDAPDPISGKLCQILFGDNTQVAGKLERAVKGLSLRPRDENATELVVGDKDEESLLTHLKAALWDLWFCAKRADPPCDPMDAHDPKVKAAREQAFDALHAIQSHAEKPHGEHGADEAAAGQRLQASGTQAASEPSPAGLSAAHPSRYESFSPHQGLGPNGAALVQKAALSQEPTPVANASEWAVTTMNGLLTGPNVTGKLWDAINTMDIDDVLEQDIVKIENDEDGSMRKLKSNMLLLHECASMPDCPATNCCTPKNPTQAVYIQARNDAYVAYHNVKHDDDLAKQAYLDLLGTIGSGSSTTTYYPPGHPLHVPTTTTIYPPGHHLHGTEHQNITTNQTVRETKSAPAPPVEEGSTLLYAIITLTAVVVIAIGFLVWKTHDAEQGGKGHEAHGEAAWGEGEGEWGGEGYGQY